MKGSILYTGDMVILSLTFNFAVECYNMGYHFRSVFFIFLSNQRTILDFLETQNLAAIEINLRYLRVAVACSRSVFDAVNC